MPYPNEHAARLIDPSEFERYIRIHPKGYPEGVDAIIGYRADGSSGLQAIRADKTKLSMKEFLQLLKEWNMKPSKVEPASEPVKKGFEGFSTWTSLSLVKAGEEGEVEPRAEIEGLISSDCVDLQGDRILQEGMDWSYFLKRGWLNYEHQQGPENIVGVPSSVTPVSLEDGKQGSYLKGYLLLNRPKAKEIASTALALKAAGADRKIGFSVEGQVLARDPRNPKIITKSRILNVSVTAHPVNPDASTLEVIARSLDAVQKADAAPTAKTIVEHILRMHPELQRKEVLMELLNELDGEYKGVGAEVGYQTPARPATGSSLSALVPASIEEEVSIAVEDWLNQPSDPDKKKAGDMEEEDDSMDGEEEDSMDGEGEEEQPASIESVLSEAVKDAMKQFVAQLMQEEVSKLLSSEKSATKPMISMNQLINLIGKTFPHMPPAAQKEFARKLISTSSSYKN